uniref:DUF2889 domain-containing protein n=1 Tax=uncultured Thiotrichaceae bacterium TaxID=298394 RepID=A0A6S6U198_9GAMM|nr:MAG: Unknown protein [uncultured Thiotrichaceae bacterium]
MPLSTPARRQSSHTRVVTCNGYEREDGLWDIEGRIVDTKALPFSNKDRGGSIEAGEALHDMSLRLTIDTDMKIHAAEQCTDFSPYNYCQTVEHFCENLIGQHIGPGWTKMTKIKMGAGKGCTHLTELLIPMATTAFQTLVKAKSTGRTSGSAHSSPPKIPGFMNSCHALQVDGPIVKEHWPQFYTAE